MLLVVVKATGILLPKLFPYASLSVTLTVELPVVAKVVTGFATMLDTDPDTSPAVTVTGNEEPVMELAMVSVAVIVRLPTDFKVTLKDSTPFVSVASAPSVAALSVLVKCNVPV